MILKFRQEVVRLFPIAGLFAPSSWNEWYNGTSKYIYMQTKTQLGSFVCIPISCNLQCTFPHFGGLPNK